MLYLKVLKRVAFLPSFLAGHNVFAVKVVSDISSCGSASPDVESSKSTKQGDEIAPANIAVTISSLCAALGLIAAAIVVCLKCRRARPPVKKQRSK